MGGDAAGERGVTMNIEFEEVVERVCNFRDSAVDVWVRERVG